MAVGRGRGTGAILDHVAFRSIGLGLILGGTIATLAAMFLPAAHFGGDSLTWWEWMNGLDVALAIACGNAGLLALVSLVTTNLGSGSLPGVVAAVAFGLAFAPVPGAIDDSEAAKAGLWIVASTGAIALAGAVLTTVWT